MYEVGDEVEVVEEFVYWEVGDKFIIHRVSMLHLSVNPDIIEQAVFNEDNHGIWSRHVVLATKHKLEDFI